MDISKINELLKENEKIQHKIGELKRKLNLKNYNQEQKKELNYIINTLKNLYIENQSICSNLSEMKAGTFANLVCKILYKKDPNYKIKCLSLKFKNASKVSTILKHYTNQVNDTFLVVTNREFGRLAEIPEGDISLIPIAYLQSQFATGNVTESDLVILENKNIQLFDNPDLDNIYTIISDIKTFNLGKAGEEDKVKNSFTKLKNEIKAELGIWSKSAVTKIEKQL